MRWDERKREKGGRSVMQKKEREVLSCGQQINEHAPEQGGKRDCEKVTKVHFIEFWVAVLSGRKNVPYKLINFGVSLVRATARPAAFIPTRPPRFRT